MRKLFVLRGAQGSGKSSLISQWGVEGNTLGFDKFRQLFYSTRSVLDEGGESSTGNWEMYEKDVISACLKAVESRMHLGDTLFIDNMSIAPRDLKNWATLANKYFYDMYVVDVQGDLTTEELLRRNTSRGRKMVAPSVVERCADRGRNTQHIYQEGYTFITPDEVPSLLDPEQFTIDASKYAKVVVVGDVHGYIDELRTLTDSVGGIDNEDVLFVFVGDLIDRGPYNAEVVDYVNPSQRANVIVCEGNHEMNMRHVLSHTSNTRFSQTRDTRNEMLDKGWTASDIRSKLLDPLVPAVRLTNVRGVDRDIVVSHAGCDTGSDGKKFARYAVYGPVTEFVYGTSDRDKVYRGRSSYGSHVDAFLADNTTPDIIQIHGHRNPETEDGFAWETGHIYNVESGVTTGHCMRAAIIDNSGISNLEIPVTTGAVPPTDHTPVALTERDFATSDLIRAKDCGEGITSYNFTRDAFQSGAWTDVSIRARGLFLRDGKVVGRGYDKFFNMGERNGYTREEILDNFQMPVTVSRKVNGFLGIMFALDGDLKLFSKSGPTDYSTAAWEMLNLSDREKTVLTKILSENNVSLTLEIVHPHDPHIVLEEHGVYILDVIRNDLTYTPVDEVRTHIENLHITGFKNKQLRIVHTKEDLDRALTDACETTKDEGIVLRDVAGRMAKVKADHYTEVKRLRTALNRALRGDTGRLQQSSGVIADAIREQIGVDGLTKYEVVTLNSGNPVGVDIPRLIEDLHL